MLTFGVPRRLTGGRELMFTAGREPTFTVGVLTTLTFWGLVVGTLAICLVCALRVSAAPVTARQLRTNKSLARNAKNFIIHLLYLSVAPQGRPKIGLHLYRRRIKAKFAPPAEFFSQFIWEFGTGEFGDGIRGQT